MNTTTDEILTTETEQEMTEMFKQHLDNLGKSLTKKQAMAYAEALRAARTSKDFNDVRKVWAGAPKGKFTKKDYETIIRPVINEDLKLVNETLAQLAKAHGMREFKKLFKLPRPVVPSAYRHWKTEAMKISLTVMNTKYTQSGSTLTNAITVAR